jgi:hypothetical protein
MKRSYRVAATASAAALLALAAINCGSVSPQSDSGSPAGSGGAAGGASGSAGQAGAGGDQGSAGRGGAGGGGSGSAGMTGRAGSTGGAGNTGGAGAGHAGADGGAAGSGGVGDAGAKDAAISACAQPATVDHTCSVDADCLAVTHTTSCCGSAIWIGIRSSEKDHFAALESACDRTYPACGCAAGPPLTDDGSVVPFGGMAGVSCRAGTCKTFSKACGQACATGRSCVTCMMPDAGATSSCSLTCMKDTDCTEAGRTKCQFVFASGTCVSPTLACGAF